MAEVRAGLDVDAAGGDAAGPVTAVPAAVAAVVVAAGVVPAAAAAASRLGHLTVELQGVAAAAEGVRLDGAVGAGLSGFRASVEVAAEKTGPFRRLAPADSPVECCGDQNRRSRR